MKKTIFIFFVAMVLAVTGTTYGKSYMATDNLWIKAVINADEGPIDAVFYKGGENLTERGDTVIWGYFYADPNDVSWGHEGNPDLYVKIWFDITGRIDVNFFHVSVPDIDVYTDYPYNGTFDKHGIVTTDERYVRHEYFEDSSETISAVYPMFVDDNNNGINDYTEKETHFSGSGVSSRSTRHGGQNHGSMDNIQRGVGLYNHAFTDLNNDGICDYAQNGSSTWHGPGFTDEDGNGVCDYWDADSPSYNRHGGVHFQDRNSNFINDYSENQWHDGHRHTFTDLNGDGVCDYAQDGSDMWHGPNFTDADDNGVCDYWQSGGKGHGGQHP